jgi:RNA polymerase sigma-70 factor (ECF subfamily)
MAQRLSIQLVFEQVKSNADSEGVFEVHFQKHWPRIYGVLFRMVGDAAEAEDLALEVFWQLYQKSAAKRGMEIENLAGWLYRVAVNMGYNALRSRKRRHRYELEAGYLSQAQTSWADPPAVMEQSQQREAVRYVLAQMKPRAAQVLVLRHSGMSYSEIAEALQLSPGSIGTILARAEEEFERVFKREVNYG